MTGSKEEKEKKKPLKCRFKSICIFGETNTGKDVEFLKAAKELGNVLADRNIKLVYGGGIQGLSGSAAISASFGGSKVLSVLIKALDDKKYVLGSEIRVSSLPERMGCMLQTAEAFIALPGGLEMLNGISNIIYWVNLNFHQKPLGLLNVNGFYDGLLSFFDLAVEQGFIPQATRSAIMSASTAEQLINQLQNYAPKAHPLVKQIDCQSSNSSMKQEPDTTLRL